MNKRASACEADMLPLHLCPPDFAILFQSLGPPELGRVQQLAAPRGQRRSRARGRIMKPRHHERPSGNHISQLVREGVFSCRCVVAVVLCGPPWAQGVIYERGIGRQTGYSCAGGASDCRVPQQSDGPLFDSGWPEFGACARSFASASQQWLHCESIEIVSVRY